MVRLEKRIIEDVIALTPLQEGIFYHYLEDIEGSQYSEIGVDHLLLRYKNSNQILKGSLKVAHTISLNYRHE